MQIERILYDQQSQTLMIMSLDEYQSLTSIVGKEELQLILPARDIYSDEIRVLITNSKLTISINFFSGWKREQQHVFKTKMCSNKDLQRLRKR